MTIAIGILARDGLVIAADSQETHHDFIKLEGSKVFAVLMNPDTTDSDEHPKRTCIITGAGDSRHIDAIKAELIDTYRSGEGKDDDTIEAECRERVRAFYVDRVAPFSSMPMHERPEFRLIIGTHMHQGPWLAPPRLMATERTLLYDAGYYTAVGIGAVVALPLLQRMYQIPTPDVRTAIVLASYVMSQTKELVEGCGKSTDISGIYNGQYFGLSRSEAKVLEEAMRDYTYAVEPLMLRQFTHDGGHANKQAATLAKRRLRNAVDTLNRFIPLGGRPIPQPPTGD